MYISPTLKKVFIFCVYLAAAFGVMVVLFFGLHAIGVFNEQGGADPRAELFLLTRRDLKDASIDPATNSGATVVRSSKLITCMIEKLDRKYPTSADRVYAMLEKQGNYDIAYSMLLAAGTADAGLLPDYATCESQNTTAFATTDAFAWINSEEWAVLKTALTRDAEQLNAAARATGVPVRILVGPIIGEQLRFYTSARAVFKSYLQPKNSFIHLSKFSHGVAGMKPETAERIENMLTARQSIWYIGPEYENLLAYPQGVDVASERMNRLDSHDHYYSYLYVGLYLRQFMAQWKSAGFDISMRPDVLATLYNLGHNRSIPKENPTAGGAIITINGKQYSFGGLAYDFYWSGELQELFPY